MATGMANGLSVEHVRSGAFARISCQEMKRREDCCRTPSSIDAQAIANHQLVRELAAGSHATFLQEGRVVHEESVIAQNLLTPGIELVYQRHASSNWRIATAVRAD